MPKPFRLKVFSTTTKLDKRFKNLDFIQKQLQARIEKTKEGIQDSVSEAVEKAVRKSRVYRALVNPPLGVIGYDLPAEFGLNSEDAENAAELMVNIVKDTVRVEVSAAFQDQNSAKVKISTKFMNPDKYTKLLLKQPFWYTSRKQHRKSTGKQSTRYRIDWMKWILEASRGDSAIYGTLPSVREYGISYGESANALNRFSRSGRALMIHGESKRGRGEFPYGMPEVIKPKAGAANFLEEISRSRPFVQELNRRVKRVIDEFLIPRKR